MDLMNMTNYIIEENINNLNSKQRFSTDPFLSKLINILLTMKNALIYMNMYVTCFILKV